MLFLPTGGLASSRSAETPANLGMHSSIAVTQRIGDGESWDDTHNARSRRSQTLISASQPGGPERRERV